MHVEHMFHDRDAIDLLLTSIKETKRAVKNVLHQETDGSLAEVLMEHVEQLQNKLATLDFSTSFSFALSTPRVCDAEKKIGLHHTP